MIWDPVRRKSTIEVYSCSSCIKAQDNTMSNWAVDGQPAAGVGEEFITWQQTVDSPALIRRGCVRIFDIDLPL